MNVADIFKVVRLVSWYKDGDGERFNGCVAPSVIVDAALVIDVVDVTLIVVRQPELEGRQFEIVVEHALAWPGFEERGSYVVISDVTLGGRPKVAYPHLQFPIDSYEPVHVLEKNNTLLFENLLMVSGHCTLNWRG